MEDIDTKYKNGSKLVLEIRDQLEQLESGNANELLEGRISTSINELSRISGALEQLMSGQTATKTELWRIRISQLKDECRTFRSSFGTYIEKKYEKERSRLLERRTKTISSDRAEQLVQEGDSLNRSNVVARDLESQAKGIIQGLYQQNELVRGMLDKMYSMGTTLGTSRTLMKVIERRTFVDKIIVYSGMVFTLLFIGVLYYYVRM